MSQQLISRSPDLQRLQDEGYDLEIRGSHILVKGVPYVNASRSIAYGTLVSVLDLAGDITTRPSNHVAYFAGDHPCHKDGTKITRIEHGSGQTSLDKGLIVHHSFSSKPPGGYTDYHHKLATYVAIISGPAQALDPSVTAQSYPVVAAGEDESVFHYRDTASSRAGIMTLTRKLELARVAIVGVGGTGSYVLDLIAKTPVGEIHLFDGDTFSQHNAFRSPGAPSLDDLQRKPLKASYFTDLYSRMHRSIIGHAAYLDETTVNELRTMDFVFICLDAGVARRLVVETLESAQVAYIDVGMGLQLDDGALGGVVRVTTSAGKHRHAQKVKDRLPFNDATGNDDYSRNIQVADLNAMNAALAVIKWKKLYGFYRDLEAEFFTTYTIDSNTLINEDRA